MRTDLEVIIDGINTLLSTSPQTTYNHGGLIVWEHAREKALAECLQKLKEAPFYAITTTTPDACDCGTRECDLDDELEEDRDSWKRSAIAWGKLEAAASERAERLETTLKTLRGMDNGLTDSQDLLVRKVLNIPSST